MAKLGCMTGYPDGTFQPEKFITRAEAVVTLSHVSTSPATGGASFDRAGTYGPEAGIDTLNGGAVINVAGVTVRNTVINGDLLLGAGIGEGEVTLENVTVKGKTTIKGGGDHSVILDSCNMPTIVVDKEGVRVVATGSTTVSVITLESGAVLVEVSVTGEGFNTVAVAQTLTANTTITLTGIFETVNLSSAVNVNIASGAVNTLNVDAAANITGQAAIATANINVSGSTIQQSPGNTNVATGKTAVVAGVSVS
ncbi:MAG: S-layer homology domain-containing protein, partial [Desulfocucumaceae bacterium]